MQTSTRDGRLSPWRSSASTTSVVLLRRLLVLLVVTLPLTTAQDYPNDYDYNDYEGSGAGANGNGGGDYQDYTDPYAQPDNLYADYAATKLDAGATAATGGLGWGKLVLCSGLSWFMGGKFHAGRTAQKLKAKHLKEQKQLYTQYYNDVYKLSEQNQETMLYVEQLTDALKSTKAEHEMEAIQRDYDEFKQPDIDSDDRISRAEFNMYVKNYLANYPGLSEADYPKFEDFDHDGDGYVSFKEYAQQMAVQSQKAESDELYGTSKGKSHQGLQDLYKETAKQASQKYR